jgi:stable inheritance KleE-like protein
MAKIINFPNVGKLSVHREQVNRSVTPIRNRVKSIFFSFLSILWIILATFWTPIRWIISIEVLFQLIRMLYYWDTEDVHTVWIFLLHFGVLTALTLFMASYKLRFK